MYNHYDQSLNTHDELMKCIDRPAQSGQRRGIVESLLFANGDDELPDPTTVSACTHALLSFVTHVTRNAAELSVASGVSRITPDDLYLAVGDDPGYVNRAKYILKAHSDLKKQNEALEKLAPDGRTR